ncbi:MAG: carboxypeptidase-like regulatory domain-containing protein [Bacteroidetes bacterium]|nr:MAG: carboxypeptidase-like regulatory domain-containing protein [Bacteroidota bacterium]
MTNRHIFFLFFLLFSIGGMAQSIEGRVLDEHGVEIPFAKVRVFHSSRGTVANALGIFKLNLDHTGPLILQFSAPGYHERIDSLDFKTNISSYTVTLREAIQQLNEVTIISKTEKERGKEIMKQVQKKRSFYYKQLKRFRCETYCLGSLEKEIPDSLETDSIIDKKSLNLIEWKGFSYYQADSKFKDVFTAFNDLTDDKKVSLGTDVSISMDYGPTRLSGGISESYSDPYLFASSFKELSVNLFENQLVLPHICPKPIVSPLAFNAGIYYNFFLEETFTNEDSLLVYVIRLEPKFSREPLFNGKLYIEDESWAVLSYDLGINPAAMTYFKQMRLLCDYEMQDQRLVPKSREFVYLVHERKSKMNGHIQVQHQNYAFDFDDKANGFWQETSVFEPTAYVQDTAFWNEIRPFKLKSFEERFILQQDSAIRYHESEEYMRKMDSIRNKFSVLTFIFAGWRHVNSFKGLEYGTNGIITQLIPFGVGGFRYRPAIYFSKEFKNAQRLILEPTIDYGFLNRDLKGALRTEFMYDPLHFSSFYFKLGDIYDYVSNYQNIQGTFAPANRVRNRSAMIGYKSEILNGLYFQSEFLYSQRESIDSLKYPSWVKSFGQFSDPQSFETYKIFLTTIDLEFHPAQKYIIRKNKKVILGSKWPVINLKYKKGIPDLAGTEANFDFLQIRARDEIPLNTLGKLDLNFEMGSFLRKKDLRLIEYKFFRTSDRYFFSNPLNSMQLLDTALNTSNSYWQFNFIHHFNGFFLNKIWLINRLKLEETIGGSMLYIPDANFAQAELYVGLERQFRIRKEIFKLGIYAVTYSNSITSAAIRLKFGFNNYNSFSGTWDY